MTALQEEIRPSTGATGDAGRGLDRLDQGVTVFIEGAWWPKRHLLRLLDFPDSLALEGVSQISSIAERGDYGPGDPEAQIAERWLRARSFQPHATERIRPWAGRILSIRGFRCRFRASTHLGGTPTSPSSAAPRSRSPAIRPSWRNTSSPVPRP